MPGIIYGKVEDYLYSLLPKRDAVLSSIEKDAEKNDVPIIGPLVGNVISILLRTAKAERALEIGTATGYSGIWILRALSGANRKLVTVEMDESRRRIARKNFERADLGEFVEMLPGNAKQIIPDISREQKETFDVAFLDVGDKSIYVELLGHCLSAVRPGGFLIADNTLWDGEVADPRARSIQARTMRKFNEIVFKDEGLDAALIPLRDGFTVARKKKQ